MSNQAKNPIFWSAISFFLGIVIGALGLLKADCIGPNCWIGSGLLKWTGGILIVAGAIGFLTTGNRK